MGNWVAWKFDYLVGKFKKNIMEMLFFLMFFFAGDVLFRELCWCSLDEVFYFEQQAQVVKVLIHPEWLIEPLQYVPHLNIPGKPKPIADTHWLGTFRPTEVKWKEWLIQIQRYIIWIISMGIWGRPPPMTPCRK